MKKPHRFYKKKRAKAQQNNLIEPKVRADAPDISEPLDNSDSSAPLFRRPSAIKHSNTMDSHISESMLVDA